MALIKITGDPSRQQTAAGIPPVAEMNTAYAFTQKENEVLQALARQVADISQRDAMQRKARLWTAHNELKTDIPLVFIDPENGWNEIIPSEKILCEDPLARVWEMGFRKLIFWANEMKDDKVVERYFDVPYVYTDDGWGLTLGKAGGGEGQSYIVKQALKDYEEDFNKIHYPRLLIDQERSTRLLELAQTLFDGILEVRRKTTWWWTLGMTWEYINMRGLEDFMCDFITEPEWVHRTMNLLCEGILRRLDFLSESGMLALNNEGTYVGSGGLGYTSELPRTLGRHVTPMDMWGFVESQETSSVSPEMYGEFIFPYHRRIAERFGLNCYGCCEPYNPRWDYVKQLPRLRRVSCSPWADWRTVPENLGKNYIASIKPMPTPLASKQMDETAARTDARRAVQQSKGGICEFLMKDNHTLGHNPRNATRWVEIMREEIDLAYSSDAVDMD